MELTTYCIVFIAIFGQIAPVLSLQMFCYYTNWAQYRQGSGKFLPKDIDPTLCTHILFAFGTLSGTELRSTEWNDDAMIKQVLGLKSRNPNLNVLISVGGWNAGSTRFSNVASTYQSRMAFVESVMRFLERYRLDGFDMDWEYPTTRGGRSQDKQNFVLLLQALKRRFGNRYLLTIAVGAGKNTIDVAYDVPRVARAVDYVLLMTYDFHGSWEKVTGHVSPLYSKRGERGGRQYLNVDYAVRYWISNGAPASKLVMGMPFYGRSYTLADSQVNGMMAPAPSPGNAGPISQSAGLMSYNEICLIRNSWTRHWDNEHKVPYIVRGNQWLGYEDQQSLRIKSQYIINKGLAGAMIWSMDMDDFNNACGEGRYPLLRTVVNYMRGQVRVQTTPRRYTIRPNRRTTRIPIWTPVAPITRAPSRFRCPSQGSMLLGDPFNRRIFHFCSSGRDYIYNCPPTLVWDSRIRACNYAR